MRILIALFLLIPSLAFASQKAYLQVRASEKTAYGQWNSHICYEIPDDKVDEVMKLCGVEQKKVDEDVKIGVDLWVHERENPPVYVEPTEADYLSMYEAKIAEATEYFTKYSEKASVEEIQAVKSKLADSVVAIDEVITEKSK